MTPELRQIQAFLASRGGLFNWRVIETRCGLPKGSIKEFVFRDDAAAVEPRLPELTALLATVGGPLPSSPEGGGEKPPPPSEGVGGRPLI
jgi:hypothetical protein